MSRLDEIRELDPTTVERIAAGEVVERPASAVKELLENSLDADATRIRVAVEAGGTETITVSDDGRGMTESQVRAAVQEHTTSKIRDIDDLETGVTTLGFRGEALHAIGAVSRLTITTRPQGSERGTRLRVEGGDVTSVQSAGCPEGTTVTVEDLFYNVPARRKYLSREATEFDHVNTIVTNYALANPTVAVELEHDGRETFVTSGQGSLRETVMAVYGREVAESMIEVSPAEIPDGPLSDVSGLVSHPETNRASREYLSTFVNSRYVRSNDAREAVIEAYGTQLAPDRYPFTVLDLALPAAEVDVNVHPRKMRARFQRPEALKRQIRTVIETTLREEGLLRSAAPRGRSAPDQTSIQPNSTTGDTVESDGDTVEGSDSDEPVDRSKQTAETPRTARTDNATSSDSRQQATSSRSHTTDDHVRPASTPESGSSGNTSKVVSSSAPEWSHSTIPTEPATQTTLDGEEAHPRQEYDTIPGLRVLGQLHDTYIVAETDGGLILIDQHAADERINYERLKEAFEGNTTTQALAEPETIELTAAEAERFDAFEAALARLGFQATRVDDRTITIQTVPTLVGKSAGASLVRDVLADLVVGQETAERTVESVADQLLADMACHPAITGQTSLTDGSIRALLSELEDCENPWACPHGRPVIIEIDADELADRFERDYPGHGPRSLE